MPKYLYVCPECDHKYDETREVDQAQIFTRCNGCGQADYNEVTE